jgi:streptomycin 6-kinase
MRHLDPIRLDDPLWFAAAGDPDGREWITSLPGIVDEVCRRWRLDLETGTLRNGFNGVVIPVRRRGEPAVLKLTWPPHRTHDAARALSAWDGEGAVRMLAADVDVGALLLERARADLTLSELDIVSAATIAGRLLRRLAIPTRESFPSVDGIALSLARTFAERQQRLGFPIPGTWLDKARSLSEELTGRGRRLLIHADLHYGNVLASDREPWLAIDPKALVGDPEHAVAELVWTRLDEVDGREGIRALLAALVESGRFDASLARSWVIVRCVDYWLWGLEHGLTEDPKRCRRIIAALMEKRER